MRVRRLVLAGCFVVVVTAPAAAQLDRLLKGLPGFPQTGELGDAKIGTALKEALLSLWTRTYDSNAPVGLAGGRR